MKQVTAALLFYNNKLLISRRHKKDILAGKWEFPGGKVESQALTNTPMGNFNFLLIL